jgi:hypothetical protein
MCISTKRTNDIQCPQHVQHVRSQVLTPASPLQGIVTQHRREFHVYNTSVVLAVIDTIILVLHVHTTEWSDSSVYADREPPLAIDAIYCYRDNEMWISPQRTNDIQCPLHLQHVRPQVLTSASPLQGIVSSHSLDEESLQEWTHTSRVLPSYII